LKDKKIGLVSLGCPKNKVDAEVMLKKAYDDGFIIEENIEECDAVIINTCGFIESAKKEAVEEIFNAVTLKEQGKIQKIVVTGCFSKRYHAQIEKEIPEVDAVLGITQYNEIGKYLRNLFEDDKKIVDVTTDLSVISCGDRINTQSPFRADIKIAEGCSNNCAYCAIPSIRGPFRSRDEKSILLEAESMITRGIKEITLIAQDTTRYGLDIGGTNLNILLKKLAKMSDDIWIRILYAYPEMVSRDLIETISSNNNITNYIDIPLQHINDSVLKRMNRRSDRKLIEEKYKLIKAINPDIAIRTTFITGFPGETKQDFKELYDFIADYPFENVGVFAFSPEEGTPAYGMIDQVKEKIAVERRDKLMKRQMEISKSLLEKRIGQNLLVLAEDFCEEGYIGRSQQQAADIDGTVIIKNSGELIPGEFYNVKIKSCTEYDLIGEVC
jgi:ribosomal protein S12 methylthiotransferase